MRRILGQPIVPPDTIAELTKRLFSLSAVFLDFYGSNVVFLILDQITLLTARDARAGRSSLKITITAHGVAETATRFLVA